MFPEELTKLLNKHKDSNHIQIENINSNIKDIIKSLKNIRNNLSSELFKINTSDEIVDATEILADIKTLKEQISYIETLPIQTENKTTEVSEKLSEIPRFTNKVILHSSEDDICLHCNVKFTQHHIRYQRIINNKLCSETKFWYKCPVCNRLFIIDYEIEDFDFSNTNITIKKRAKDKINFADAIVIFNINKCSKHNHDIEDVKCEIPIIVSTGEVMYGKFPLIHCKTCNKYIMLKSTYDTINGVPACIIVDETNSSSQYTENEFYYGDSSGSKLHQYGYNVNNQDKLTEEQRHTILSLQLLSENITKGEICSILDTNIARGSNRKESKRDWSKAVSKWKADKEYVLNLDLEKESKRVDIDKLVLRFSKNL